MESPISDYGTLLEYYSRRALTHESDALKAVAGIMRRVSVKLGYPMIEGLPTGAFDAFILFEGTYLARRHGFPSYSWAGWRGGIRYSFPRDISKWLSKGTWIVWNKRSGGALSPVWDPATHKPPSACGAPETGYQTRVLFRHPEIAIGTAQTTVAGAIPPPPQFSNFPYSILQFWTLVTFYRLHSWSDDISAWRAIINKNGTICGKVILDGFDYFPFFDSDGVFEFLVLSETGRLYESPMDERRRDEYNVMLVEWIDGVAERRGIGEIYKDAVLSANSYPPGPVWKEILLG